MFLVLVQRPKETTYYKDVPFELYHFPKKQYASQIETGSRFIYYKSQQHAAAVSLARYYFGAGVIGKVWDDPDDPTHAYAEVLGGLPFSKHVPLRAPDGSYFESRGRNGDEPPFRSAVRVITAEAYRAILSEATTIQDATELDRVAQLESTEEPLVALARLNTRYAAAGAGQKRHLLQAHVDRGVAVTRALKKILGARCQICLQVGFLQPNGTRYVEAHHVDQVAALLPGSLCSDNVILVCPTCHRRLHYGIISVTATPTSITIQFESESPVVILRNTQERLGLLTSTAGTGDLYEYV